MRKRGKLPVAISLAELTVLAMEDRERRYDWSWLMCFYVREWEKKLALSYEKNGKTLINSHFAWFHYHEICDRTLAGAEHLIDAVKEAIQSKDPRKLSEYTLFLVHGILMRECEREFELLTRAVEQHELPTYVASRGGR
jgi:hypothetical protein